ncbi:glycine zipper 2TM domain-containing protein [Novosphingobium lentum]|uniref:glycine zipper 2TM domain-containing protein n=1 Tax=Novosphingobium lentum TaxID=145287 RepID=UPI00082D9D6B|nr:glycine zipper 2TM domain-containing protein [Novosphingobium lentum]
MKKMLLMSLAATTLLGGCATTGYGDGYAEAGDYGYYDRGYYSQNGRYDYNNPDPRYGGYYADRYYRNDSRYHEHTMSNDDRVYRGRDGRYYCRRSDGTTGLIVGGIAGGVLGNIIAEGDSKTFGTVLGAIAGGAAGAAIDSSNSRTSCR